MQDTKEPDAPEPPPLTMRQISDIQRAQAATDALEQLHLANGVSLDEVQSIPAP